MEKIDKFSKRKSCEILIAKQKYTHILEYDDVPIFYIISDRHGFMNNISHIINLY